MEELLKRLFAPKPNQGMSSFQFSDLFDNDRWETRTKAMKDVAPKRQGDDVYYRQYMPREAFKQESSFIDSAPEIKRVTKEDGKGVTVTTTESFSDVPSVPNYYGKPGQMQHSVYQSPIRNVPYQYSAEEARSDVSAVPRTRFPRVGTLDPYQPLLPPTGGPVGGRPYAPSAPPATSRFVPWTPSINERTDVAPVPLTRFPREANLNSGSQFKQRSFVHPFMPVLDALIPPASADLSSPSLLADNFGELRTNEFGQLVPTDGSMSNIPDNFRDMRRDQYGNLVETYDMTSGQRTPIPDNFRDMRRDQYGNLVETYDMTSGQRDAVNELRRAQQFEQAENYREPSFLDSISEGLGGFKDDVIQGNPAIRELLKMLRWTD